MKSKDFLLLKKLKDGDVSAYKELFDVYYLPLCIYSLKFSNSIQQSEDIVQDLFMKFWDKKLYLHLDGGIKSYLYKAVKNNTLLLKRKEAKYIFEEIEEEVFKIFDNEFTEVSALEEDKKKLFIEVEQLPTKRKEVFKAIVLDGLKYKEVAEQLNVSLNTVKTHYSRALKQLRKSL